MKRNFLSIAPRGLGLALVALSAITAVPAMAQPQNMKPGQYEYTAKTEVFGISIPVSFKQCVTQKDIDSNSAYVNQQGVEGCTPPEVKRNGEAIAIKYSCTKPKSSGEGTGTVKDDSFNFDMKVTQHESGQVVRTRLTAKRLGDCK